MPFGSFAVSERTPVARPMKAAPPPPPAPPMPRSDGSVIHVLVVGRNLSIVREFLCSMSQNMGDALQTEGLAYYTRELQSISEVTAKKKQLEQFFWSFSQADWGYPEDQVAGADYAFCVGPAGDQRRAAELALHCVTPNAQVDFSGADAVWLLTDGLLAAQGQADPYTNFLQNVLYALATDQSGRERTVCLVLSQIEAMGHFDTPMGRTKLPDQVWNYLLDLCRSLFGPPCGGMPVSVIPVQVYGGMECVGPDGKGDPVLRIGRSGFYQSYIPENCQIPALHTIEQAARSRELFPNMAGSGLTEAIRNHYSRKFGVSAWAPDLLRNGGAG